MKRSAISVMLTALLCCTLMAIVDGIIQPGYWVKSTIKITLFLLIPLLLSRLDRSLASREIFRFRRRGFLVALVMGLGVYGLILGGYYLISPIFDFSGIAGNLSQNAGVNKGNFLPISLYISFVNSFLEEFFFRGFIFTNLDKSMSRPFAYGFSATVFSLYHVAMMLGWFPPVLFVLILLGLVVGGIVFNYLNTRLETMYGSWLIHMFANFAINTIGFILMT